MTAKGFFRKVGRGLQSGAGQFTKAVGGAAGQVLGKAAAQKLLSSLATTAEEGAVMALKTGGYIRAPRNKPVLTILHGGESVIPANSKVTKKQKAVISKNKKKQKMGSFVYN